MENMTLAQIFKDLEKKAKEYEEAETIKGENAALGNILLAGLTMLIEGREES